MIFETDRLIVRQMTLDDLHATRAIVCDEQTMYAWNGAWSEDENRAGLEKQLRGYTEDGFGRWAVVLKETGAFIGMCGLQWCDTDRDRVLEIGYLFNRAYWHKGYAAEAAIACKRYAFDVLGYDEVFSLARDTNIPSMNVAIRNGMIIRGRFIKHYKGENMPHCMFSVRKNDECVSNRKPTFTDEELAEAHRSLLSTLIKCEKVLESDKLPKSQMTLTERRVAALKIALTLIENDRGK
jgi:RimJ/RimL family protein N-acetyltransferase